MSRTLKRTLAAVLSIVLTLSCLFVIPFTASAATTKNFALQATPEYKAGKITGVELTINAKSCVGFKDGKFVITYDSKVLAYDEADLGKDAAEVNDKCNPEKNSFTAAINSEKAGTVQVGCFFLESLMSATNFKACLKKSATSINVNSTDFELIKIYFTVKDTSAKSTSFKVTLDKTAYTTSGCTVSFVCAHPSYAYVATKKATMTASGKKSNACTVCGYVKSTSTIAKIDSASIKLSYTSTTYTGSAKKPTVTVKNTSGTKLTLDKDYTVTYSNNTAIGKASVKITFKGNYSGSKTLNFTIKPKAVTGLAATQTANTITLSWTKVSGAAGYRVYKYNSSTKAYTQVASTTGTSVTISKLSSGTAYTYYVKAYKTVSGTTYTSPEYTQIKTGTKTAAPAAPTLTAGSGKITAKWSSVKGATGYQFCYATSKSGTYSKFSTTKLTYTKTGLTKGKTYYVKIRTYKTVNGTKIYSSYSTAKAVTVK